MRSPAFTLIEVLVCVAAVSLLTAAAVGFGAASRPLAASSAADSFDAALDYARTVAASSGNGATIVFLPRKDGRGARLRGFTMRVYSGRPNAPNALQPAALAPLVSQADVGEAALGGAPLSIFINGAGSAVGQSGAVDSSSVQATEPACPDAGGRMILTFADPRTSLTRSLACPQTVAGPAATP